MRTKIFAKTVEEEALAQIEKMSACEAYGDCEIRIMPDCHAGKGCTIGTVISIKDRIVPNTVGVDIGCGMSVFDLGCEDIDLAWVDKRIHEQVPSGFNIHENSIATFPLLNDLYCKNAVGLDKAERSIGTLGGGNHFIEINVADNGRKFLVIHSGSRNLGVRVCDYYQKLAETRCFDKSEAVHSLIEKLKAEGRQQEINDELKKLKNKVADKELAYLEGNDAEHYLHDMSIVQQYASFNRRHIANLIFGEIHPLIETIHNYIDVENKILRKGAVSARKDELLIIPMNMRDGSLICCGKGNSDWLHSAPHGAGRLMSRKKAKETLDMGEFRRTMTGIYTTSVCNDTIDEAPMAYKPVEEIMECIQDTVEVLGVIKPIYNFKAK